jgi:hypothetical protein
LAKFDQSLLKNFDYITLNGKPLDLKHNYYQQLDDYKILYLDDIKHPRLIRQINSYFDQDFNLFQRDVNDYLPKTVDLSTWLNVSEKDKGSIHKIPPKIYPKVAIIPRDSGKYKIKEWKQQKRVLQLNLSKPSQIIVKTLFYPAWSAKVAKINSNGKDKYSKNLTLFYSQDGRIKFRLPSGNYRVKIWYKGTIAERTGVIISGITLSLITFFIFRKTHKKN